MSLSHPEKLVWYLEADLSSGRKTQGSAVAIRLHQFVKDRDEAKHKDPNSARTYLLTCAHVLRDRSADGKDSVGRIDLETSIRTWMPGTGRNDDQVKLAKISTAIRRIDANEIHHSKRDNPVDDWVVLEFVDDQVAQASDALYAADFSKSQPSSGTFQVVGYPGGAKSHERGIVTPTTTGPFVHRDTHLGLLRLVGAESAPGMSGGGVFLNTSGEQASEPKLRFCGLHRARQYDTLQLHAVSAQTILKYFDSDEVPYELCQKKPIEPERRPKFQWTRRAVLAGGLCATAAAGVWWSQRRTPIRIGIKQWVGYAPLVIARDLDLQRDIRIEFKKVIDVNEAARFVDLRLIDCGAWMAAAHVQYRSNNNPGRVVLKLDDSYADDGIVTRTRIDSVNELVNKKVGVQMNDAGYCLLLELCALQGGVDITKILTENIEADVAPIHFEKNDDVHAVTTYAQFLTDAVKRVPGSVLRWTAKDIAPFGIVDVLAVHEEFLAQNEESIGSLIEAWYQAVDLLNHHDERALKIASHLLGTGETADPAYFKIPLGVDELKEFIRPENVKLAGRSENAAFFRRDGRERSEFREFYDHYQTRWPPTNMGTGDHDFLSADGSQTFKHLWYAEPSKP